MRGDPSGDSRSELRVERERKSEDGRRMGLESCKEFVHRHLQELVGRALAILWGHSMLKEESQPFAPRSNATTRPSKRQSAIRKDVLGLHILRAEWNVIPFDIGRRIVRRTLQH